ncbi:hypothetical protein [Acetobacter tropicalis]|nr:hypothetical protein [Acetobacter tropicalis]
MIVSISVTVFGTPGTLASLVYVKMAELPRIELYSERNRSAVIMLQTLRAEE